MATQSTIFDHQAYFIKASIFTEVRKKGRNWFQQLYQKGLSKIYSFEKARSLGIREGIPLKNDRSRCESPFSGLMVCIIAKEKIVKVFFNCLFSFKI